MTFNINGGQINIARDSAIINAVQNNGADRSELESIINNIKDNLSDLNKEQAEEIIDVLEIVKDELKKPEPKKSRLKNCIALITSMISIVNGIPVLASNLQKFHDYIFRYIE